MSAICTPNHPAAFTGHFAPIEESTVEAVQANQYGYVRTPSYFQCGGFDYVKSKNFEVQLLTNTALNNTLSSSSVYAISGKLIAMNDGSTPVLSYAHKTVTRIGETGPDQPDFTNKTNVTGLGMVIDWREVVSTSPAAGTRLEVTVANCNWDGEHQCHRRFNIKYIVPGTKNLVKTHTLYQVGREVYIIGRLVDFEMETHTAVVVVSSVSITNGHQLGRSACTTSPSVSSGNGFKITKFTPSPISSSNNTPEPKPSTSKLNVNRDKKFTPEQPPQKEPSNGKPSKPNVTVITDHNSSPKATVDQFAGGPTNSKKGKAVKPATREDSDDGDNDESDDKVNDEDEENCEEEEQTEIAKPKRGRPRKDILKEAAKRMKKY
ncbi:hypothetical protein PTTG_09651 [Puccinia triticina 1-1 BBBD Race 1]|uniref:Uncharacterized protein n=1 Tax=Puccinia triticina (isolate 1-1 / race 1 (BBBD)) TaxID=630390 RepID=A0A180GCI7_PUCT1|nr:hypothetical protein PTTG_09651 [Puccinia triticina 1-1 BBBD Race 1]